jgi:hypothetical protein
MATTAPSIAAKRSAPLEISATEPISTFGAPCRGRWDGLQTVIQRPPPGRAARYLTRLLGKAEPLMRV